MVTIGLSRTYRFRDKRRCTSKIARKSPIFTPPVYLTPPLMGLPLEFGIGVRGPKCINDGPTRWCKKFSDRFSRFDTTPAVTDTQPPSQPPSHVAVAITLNALAKASSLKTYQFKTHCKGDSHSSKTANIILPGLCGKTKVNALTSASEMVFKFIQLHLHYVG